MFSKKLLSFALIMTLLVSSFGGFAVLADAETEVIETAEAEISEPAVVLTRNATRISEGPTSGTLESGNISWTFTNAGMLTLEGEGAMDDFDPDAAPWSEQKQYVRYIYISEGITSVGDYAFYNLSNARSVYLPDGLEAIGKSAFEKCTEIKEFELPEGLLTIGDSAFRDCLKVKEFNIPASVETIGESVFANCDKLKEINVEDGNVNYTSDDGVLFDIAMEKLIAYPGHNKNKSYDVPYGVTEIGEYAFDGCHNLSDITFPDTLVKIGGGAFNECDDLQFINIPASVTDIAQNAFLYGMSSLEEINVDEENEVYSSIDGVLYNKAKTKLIRFPAENYLAVEEDRYTLPASVRVIGQEAFYECQNITDLYVHIGVKEFEMAAFMYFDSLTDIWYDGSKANWEMIKKGEFNEKLDEVEIHFVEKTYPSFNAVKGSHYSIDKKDGGFVDFGGNEELKKSAEYSSSNPDVAMIDGDTMIAVAEGDAIITATVYYEGELLAVETRVIVSIGEDSDKFDLSPLDGYFELDEGETWDVKENISGHEQGDLITNDRVWRNLIWISSDKEVMVVKDGVFTAVGGGTAEVVAKYGKYVVRIPVKVNAKYTPEEYFQFSNGTITRYTGPDEIVKVPPTINGQTVVSIGNRAFAYNNRITKVVLPETITRIGYWAFSYCTALTDIKLHEGIRTIESMAFENCSSLIKIKIPSTVTNTGDNLFQNCTRLNTVEYAEGTTYIDGYAVKGSAAKKVILPSTATYIASEAFAGTFIESIVIPSSVEMIADRAFYNCYRLREVKFEKNSQLIEICNSVFERCSSIYKLVLPEGVKKIGYSAFARCTYLTEVVIPDTVTYLGGSAFYGCTALTDVKLSNSLDTLDYEVFYGCTSLGAIEIPQSVTYIGNSAFKYCSNLQTVDLGTNVEYIGPYAFHECSALANIDLPDSVQTIGHFAFAYCYNLTEANLGSSLETIGYNGFYYCSALTSIVIPDSVTSMGAYVFSYCDSLEDVTLGAGIRTIPTYTFYSCDKLESIVIPDNITTIGDSAFYYCQGLTDVNIGTGVNSIGHRAFANCTSLVSIDIPDNVTTIMYNAFMECYNLENVNMGNGVKTIGHHAFSNCINLKSITIPDGVKALGQYAFQYCTKLKDVKLSENLDIIYDYAFYRCTSLESIVIPDSVRSIYSYAFAYCTSLSEITLGKSVSYIGYNAFYMCPANPAEVLDKKATTFTQEEGTNIGYIPLRVEYKFKDNAWVTNKNIVITMPANTFLVSGSMKLDGKPYTEYTENQGNGLYGNKTITISLYNNSGVIDFCIKPSEYTTVSVYADLKYASSSGSESYRIGYLNCTMPEVSINAPALTSQKDVIVEGITKPGRRVKLYLDGVHWEDVRASSTGTFQKVIYLKNPKNHQTFTITAEVVTDNNDTATAEAKVRYEADAPNLEGLVLYYGRNGETKKAYDLFNNKYQQLYEYWSNGRWKTRTEWISPIKYIQWGSASSYHSSGQYYSYYFTVDLSRRDQIDKVYVVSTRDGEKTYLEAKWDNNLGKYKTNGYFDGDWGYVPNNITVEYTRVVDDVQLTLDDILQYMDVEAETFIPSITDYTSTSYSAEITVSKLLKKLFGDRVNISTEVTDVDYSQVGNDEIFVDKDNYYVFPIEGNSLIMTFDLTDGEEAAIYLHDKINNKQTAYSMTFTSIGADGEETKLAVADIMDKIDAYAGRMLNAYNLNMDTEKLINDLGKTALAEDDLVMITEKAKQLDIKKKMFVLASMVISAAKMNNISAPSDILNYIMSTINNDLKFFGNLRLLITYRIGNEYKIRWKIDPSGYVYEGVTDNRLQGVTTTLYCIANEDIPLNAAGEYDFASIDPAKVSVWDAAEYDQQNPLVTDENGRYRWDVPDGMHWRVEYKKDGYDTAYSQWLPVPPVQTDVNVGLVSHAQPKVEDIRLTPKYLRVSFDKYMKPESVADVVVGGVTLKPKYEAKTDLAGNEYAKDFVFEFGTSLALDTQYEVTVANAKSYADEVMEAYASTLTVTMESELTVADITVDGTNVSFNYINDTGKTMSFKAMCAVYAENGVMVDMKVVDVENLDNLSSNSNVFEFEKDWDTYKIYAWSTDSMLKSVMKVYTGAKQ